MNDDLKIAIILGSTRPGRIGHQVAQWVLDVAKQRGDASYELVDLADFDLDLLGEPTVPGAANRQYENERTARWGRTIDEYDGYVFVTAEYNHGIPAAFKNAVDVIYPEWVDKAVGFVGYGADGGVRAIEQWRTVVANVRLHAVRAQVSLSLFFDFENGDFKPLERRSAEAGALFDQLVPLAGAVKTLR